MKISIVGAGNVGTAFAADLSLKGHTVTLIKTSNSLHDDNYHFLKTNDNKISITEKGNTLTTTIDTVTRDISLIQNSDIVLVTVQSNYHKGVIKKIIPYLSDGQVILINPGYLATAFILQEIGDKDITIAEAESSFIDCRISEPGNIKVGFRNVRNPVGVFPQAHTDTIIERLQALDFNIVKASSVVESGLHNPNLIVHTVGAIMSIPRIEKTQGDYCMYHEVFTPSVWNILEKLDSEKMDVLEKLGQPRIPYVEACKYRNTLDDSRDAKEIFFWYAAMDTRAKGPLVVDSRYISEDVPQGLVLLESLGLATNTPTPICSSLIEIASAALQRDLRAEGRTVDTLGKNTLDRILRDAGIIEGNSL